MCRNDKGAIVLLLRVGPCLWQQQHLRPSRHFNVLVLNIIILNVSLGSVPRGTSAPSSNPLLNTTAQMSVMICNVSFFPAHQASLCMLGSTFLCGRFICLRNNKENNCEWNHLNLYWGKKDECLCFSGDVGYYRRFLTTTPGDPSLDDFDDELLVKRFMTPCRGGDVTVCLAESVWLFAK